MQGIYQIKNTQTNKLYIGSSQDIEKRIKQHKNDLNKNKHHSYKLQIDWNKYGESNFTYKILEEVNDINQLSVREKHYIDKLNTIGNGYNISDNTGTKKIDDNTKLILLKQEYNLLTFNNLSIEIENRDYWKDNTHRLNRELHLYMILPIYLNVIENYYYPKIKNKIIENRFSITVKIDSFYSDNDIKLSLKYTEIKDNWKRTLLISIGDILKTSKQYKIDIEKSIIKIIKDNKHLHSW